MRPVALLWPQARAGVAQVAQPVDDHSWVDAFVEEGEKLPAQGGELAWGRNWSWPPRETLSSGIKANLLAIVGYTVLEAERCLKGFEAAVAAAEAEGASRTTRHFEFLIKVMYIMTRTFHQASLCAVRVITLTRRSSSTRP